MFFSTLIITSSFMVWKEVDSCRPCFCELFLLVRQWNRGAALRTQCFLRGTDGSFPLSVLACLIHRQHLCFSSCDPEFSLNVVLFSSGIVIFIARRWCLQWWVTFWICLEFLGLWPRWHHRVVIWALQSNVILNFKWRLCSCQRVPYKRLCRAGSVFELLTFFPP